MPESELHFWVGQMPYLFGQHITKSKKDIRKSHIWLERMYGEGFEHMKKGLSPADMTDEDGQPLTSYEIKAKKQALLSEADKKKLHRWWFNMKEFGGTYSSYAAQDFLQGMLLKDLVICDKDDYILDDNGARVTRPPVYRTVQIPSSREDLPEILEKLAVWRESSQTPAGLLAPGVKEIAKTHVANADIPEDEDADNTFPEDLGEEGEDEPGWEEAYAPSPPRPSSPSGHTTD
jgi:hypothetical protein